jgi:membrane protein DedA with SNARE-associated domain
MLITLGLALGASWEAVRDNLEHLNRALGVLAAVTAVGLGVWLWRSLRRK